MARRKITRERKLAYAQAMRDDPTPAEEALRAALYSIGLRPKRQVIVCGYIVDFLFPAKKVVVEVDGYYHYTARGRASDRIRTNVLSQAGYKVLRVPNSKVLADPKRVALMLRNRLLRF